MKLVRSVKLNYYHYKNTTNKETLIRLVNTINKLTNISNKYLNKKDKPNRSIRFRKKKFKSVINFKLNSH